MNHIGIKVTLVVVLCSLIYFGFLRTPIPPKKQYNICQIFQQNPRWYWATLASERRWDIPISTQMAILREESHFQADAKTHRIYLLGFIPWQRETTATGYAQAVNETWHLYLLEEHKKSASRAQFVNATDFIGWYAHRAYLQAHILPSNVYSLYLAYHEGIDGYLHHSYLHKPWLVAVAHNVQTQAHLYHTQLLHCESSLAKKPWWSV